MRQVKLIRNGIIVGTCNFDNDGFISKVKIFKKFRGKGYCYFLIKKTINLAKRMSLNRLWLHVSNTNDTAIRCYKKNGFKITRKNSNYGYTMSLKIE